MFLLRKKKKKKKKKGKKPKKNTKTKKKNKICFLPTWLLKIHFKKNFIFKKKKN